MRTRTLVLLAILLTVGPVWLAGLVRGGGTPAPVRADVGSPVPVTPGSRALVVLHAWDRRRSAAWRRADPAALARLYVGGSRTGRRDVADLRLWRRRGLRVTGLEQQVASLRVLESMRRRMVVVVFDRTVGGVAVGHGRRCRVPQGGWATHRISLRLRSGSWRVAEVTALGPALPRRPR